MEFHWTEPRAKFANLCTLYLKNTYGDPRVLASCINRKREKFRVYIIPIVRCTRKGWMVGNAKPTIYLYLYGNTRMYTSMDGFFSSKWINKIFKENCSNFIIISFITKLPTFDRSIERINGTIRMIIFSNILFKEYSTVHWKRTHEFSFSRGRERNFFPCSGIFPFLYE